MPRTEFPIKVREQARERARQAGDTCECGCGFPLSTGKVEYHHRVEAELGGPSTFENCVVLSAGCHGGITAARAGTLAKVRRQRRAHAGIKPRTTRPMPGGRLSPLKRTIDGRTVSRATGEPLLR